MFAANTYVSRSRNLKNLQVDLDAMSEADLARLMSEHPKTMIRPLHLKIGVLVIGHQESRLESLL